MSVQRNHQPIAETGKETLAPGEDRGWVGGGTLDVCSSDQWCFCVAVAVS